MDDTQYCDCWRVERRATCTYDLRRRRCQNEDRKIVRRGEGEKSERGRGSVLSLDPHGSRLTDWKQAETFMAAVSRAAINPLSGLFIAQRQREFLICVTIVRGRVSSFTILLLPPFLFISETISNDGELSYFSFLLFRRN